MKGLIRPEQNNTIYVEAYALSMYVKIQLHPPYGLCEEDILIFFKNSPFMSHWQPIKLSDLGKRRIKRGGLLNKYISLKKFKYLQCESRNGQFPLSHYTCKSMGTISCHSNQSSYPTGMKNIIYVEANVINMYAKYQLYPPYGF